MEPPANSAGIIDPEAATMPIPPGGQPQAAQSAEEPSDSKMTDFSCVYFGYGSNLSARTMKQRCPDSLFIGLAELRDWKWIINETGYANIVPSPGDVVYGSLCFLSKRDEMALDESEGVPWLYEKQTLPVKRVLGDAEKSSDWASSGDVQVPAIAYVDVQRTGLGKIEQEYVVWVKKAIEDGVAAGMPQHYADKYLVPFLPTEERKLQDIVMVRTTRFGEHSAGLVPRGFASWSRG
jgi:gamma-glutamylcyclotransferase